MALQIKLTLHNKNCIVMLSVYFYWSLLKTCRWRWVVPLKAPSSFLYSQTCPRRSPLLNSHLCYKVTLFLSHHRKFIWIEPLLRGHLSWKTTFSLSQGWPLNTGLTVYIYIYIYIHHISYINIIIIICSIQYLAK